MNPLPALPDVPGVRISHIDGHRGYAVTDAGCVLSCRTNHRGYFNADWRPLEPVRDRDGYLLVKIDGRRVRVHHLVLNAFRGPCPDGQETRHMNGVRDDNRADNLAWGTRRENYADRERHGTGLRGERNPKAKLDECDVVYVRDMRRAGMTLSQIAREFDVRPWTVQRILSGEAWSHVA